MSPNQSISSLYDTIDHAPIIINPEKIIAATPIVRTESDPNKKYNSLTSLYEGHHLQERITEAAQPFSPKDMIVITESAARAWNDTLAKFENLSPEERLEVNKMMVAKIQSLA